MAKAKSKSSFDFKQVLMQHGERIGVAVAAAICGLLLLSSLFLPGSGFFAPSPDEKAKYLTDRVRTVEGLLASNKPQPDDLPPADADKQRIALDKTSVDASQFMLASLIDTGVSTGAGRRLPTIYPIDEGTARLGRIPIKAYLFDTTMEKIQCLEIGGEADKIDSRSKRMRARLKRFSSAPRGPGGPMGGSMGPRPGGGGSLGPAPGAGGMSGLPGVEAEKKEKVPVWVPIADLDKKPGLIPAIQILPRRMAVIAASFPYKKQVEEFRNRLGLKSVSEVLTEGSAKKTDPPLPAFRFIGVEVQRRELDGDGNPVKGKDGKPTDWAMLNLADDYRVYRVWTGGEPEADEPKLGPVTFRGLVMPLVKQFKEEEVSTPASAPMGGTSLGPAPGGPMGPMGMGGDGKKETKTDSKYPLFEGELDKDLPKLKKSIDALGAKPASAVATPKGRFDAEGFDPFGGTAPAAPATSGTGTGETTTEKPVELPDHCLVRVIDVTVQPGRTYEYRLRVRMGNPNFERRDVANPRYAAEEELVSEWSKVPIRLAVDPELFYYAVDQRTIDREDPKKEHKGPWPHTGISFDPERMVILQAHRWLTYAKMGGEVAREVGEWSVAERIPVHRGEYVGRKERTEVPVWYRTREKFVLPSDDNRKKGIEVDFGVSNANGTRPEPLYPSAMLSTQPEAILLDFEQGQRTYERVIRQTEEKTDVKKVTDSSATLALLLNPDGKLVLLEGARDADDPDRLRHLEEVRDRVKRVKEGSKPKESGGAFGGK